MVNLGDTKKQKQNVKIAIVSQISIKDIFVIAVLLTVSDIALIG